MVRASSIRKPRRSLLLCGGNLLVGVRDALGNRVEESIASTNVNILSLGKLPLESGGKGSRH